MSSFEAKARIQAALKSAQWQPKGSVQLVQLLQDAAREADALGDDALGYQVRNKLLEAASMAGRPDEMMVAFAWMIGLLDRDPDKTDPHTVLWYYKWVVGEASDFPSIPRARLGQMLDDMESRYKRDGSTLRAVKYHRCSLALSLGDADEARAHYRAWQDTERDHLSDCALCEADEDVYMLAWLGDDARSVERAQPLLAARRQCAEVPHVTFARVLKPLFRLGRHEEAADAHRRGYALALKLERKLVARVGDHVEWLALTGNFGRALALFEKHEPQAVAHPSPRTKLEWMGAAALLFDRLVRAGTETVSLTLPAGSPLASSAPISVPSLRDRYTNDARALAAKFDARNGNTACSAELEARLTFAERAVDFPLNAAPDEGPVNR